MRRFLFLILVSALASLIVGCSDDAPSIVLWHAYRGDEEKALKAVVETYEREHGVRVEMLAVPYEAYSAKLGAAVPHAHGPDVFIDAHERMGSYRKDQLIAEVGDAFPPEDVARFDASSVDAVTETATGGRYAIPLATKCLALFVNESLLREPPATLEDIAKLRATLPKGTYPLAYEAESAFFHAPLLHAFGGKLLDGDNFGMVGEGAARSIELVRDLTEKQVVPEEPSGSLVLQLFLAGKAATVISGPWFVADLAGKVPYRIVPLPKVAATGEPMRPLLTVDGVFLTPTGRGRRAATAFARWLGGDASATMRAKLGHQVVPNVAVWSDPAIASDPVLAPFRAAAKDAVPMPTSTTMRATWVPAEQAIRKIIRRDMAADAALTEARARFIDVLRPPPPPPSPTPLILVASLVLLGLAALLVQRARAPTFRKRLRGSLPAYKYVAHAAFIVIVLVVFPLVAGALTSFFAGTRDHPQYVGLGNYKEILTARGGPLLASGSFYLTLLVTVAWTVANVVMHVGIGLVLGLVLSRPLMRLKAVYRVLLIVPWAVPSYVTALAWKGMFHRQFGAVNAILTALGAEPVSWFSKFSTAFAANVSTNVWLGFPFMMVVTLGALTSIPKDVLEAADVDGATRWQKFRLVTLPLLRPTLLPAVVLGAVWTFNMFNVVFLVSGGEPDGRTDILISEAYRWAFTRDAQYGYAAAYAVLIFLLLLGGSRLLARIGRTREEDAVA